MRRVLGLILAGLAGFLLCTAVLLWVYAPGKAFVTPLNIDSTTKLEGIARALPTGGTGPIKAVNRTVADGEASDSSVVVFDTFTCVIKGADGPDCTDDKDPQKRLITAGTDRFATDRVTALAVKDEKYTGAGQDQHDGLINKAPFYPEKKTYPYWDGVLGKAVDATFVGEEEIEGLKTLHYLIDVPQTSAEISKGIKGTYKDRKDLWFDALTGSPINQVEVQTRKLPDGKAVLDIDLAYTAEQVSKNVADAKANGTKLGIISKGPWFSLALAALAALGSAFALAMGRRSDEADDSDPTLIDGLGGATRRRSDQSKG